MKKYFCDKNDLILETYGDQAGSDGVVQKNILLSRRSIELPQVSFHRRDTDFDADLRANLSAADLETIDAAAAGNA